MAIDKSKKLTEGSDSEVLVIYPGRFQPWHKGHKAVYDYLDGKYDNVYVATSDKVDPPKSPFNFAEKKKMMELTGMDTNNVVLTRNPYQALEITQHFDPANTVIIFAVSEKDMAEDPRFAFKPKKDGSPSYFQPVKDGNLETMDKHGYIMTVPTFNFDVLGQPMKSATEVRHSFSKMDEPTKKQLIKDLFGNYSDEVYNLMSSKITESSRGGYDQDKRRVFSGLDAALISATEELHKIMKAIQDMPPGTKVRTRFLSKFKTALSALQQQMEMTEFTLRENKKMSAQKLGEFAKGKNKVSLWEHDGKVVIIDSKSKRLQESKSVKKAVDALYNKGYVCESMDITAMKNTAGAIMKVFFDTIKKTTTVRDQSGGSHTYNVTSDKVINALKQKGFEVMNPDEEMGGLSLVPKDEPQGSVKGPGMGKTMDGFV